MFLRLSAVRPYGRRLAPFLLLAAALATPCARAESGGFTLRAAIDAALRHHPDLRRFEFRLRAADAARVQAALRPAPELALDLENFAGSGGLSGLDAAEATLTLSQLIELGGKREARLAVAQAGRGALDAERQAAQLDVLAEVTRRFIDVLELQELVTLAQRASRLAEKTVKSTERRVQAAKAPHVEADRAAVALAQTRLEQRQLESRLDAARRLLSSMWGRDDATLDGRPLDAAAGDLFRLPARGDYHAQLEQLAMTPDFLRYASEERLREADLRLAASQRRADWTFGGGLRRLQDSGDTALVASLSLPLFADRRAESAAALAEAGRDLAGAEREAATVKARTQLHALHRALADAADAVETLDASAIPSIDEALQETEYAFERGRYGYLELIDAQREYLAILRTRIEAAARAQRLAADIERLTRAPLAP